MNIHLRHQWPLLSVYFVMTVSLVAMVWISFRIGAVLLALSVLGAGLLRWRLSDSAAGWLRVRRRRIDLTVLATLGLILLSLALVVPGR